MSSSPSGPASRRPDLRVPAFERLPSFPRDFDSLTPSQKAAFLRAAVLFVAGLREGKGFRRSLRVKKMAGSDDVRELTWAPDGRATFEYGPPSKRVTPMCCL